MPSSRPSSGEECPENNGNLLDQIQDKMEKDMASLKEKHKIKMQALQDQITQRNNEYTRTVGTSPNIDGIPTNIS